MARLTLGRDYNVTETLRHYGTRIEYLERRLLNLESRGQFQDYVPTQLNVTATVDEARWTRVANLAHVWGVLDVSSATGVIEIGVPVPIRLASVSRRPLGTAMARASGASGLNVTPGHTTADPSGTALAFVSSVGGAWNATTPFSWSAGSVLAFEATFEVDM